MYCPRCGQQQITDEVRFCSRCGFPLAGVMQLLASGGALPVAGESEGESKQSPRQRGIRQGVLLWLIGTVIVPLLAVMDAASELIGFDAISLFVGGFVRLLYALLFQENFIRPGNAQNLPASSYIPPRTMPDMREAAQLPPHPFAVAPASPRINTGELTSPPPSVTDHTTRLLSDKKDDAR